jgi:pyruvate kinase
VWLVRWTIPKYTGDAFVYFHAYAPFLSPFEYFSNFAVVGGKIKDKKGVNTPDSILNISCLTSKDRADLKFMLDIGVDWVALSFVQRPEDILEIQRLILAHPTGQTPSRPKIMAKIEKPSCFEGNSLERIVELSDGIMVARGDLGVECAPEDVPILQKTIIDECRSQGKPVVSVCKR